MVAEVFPTTLFPSCSFCIDALPVLPILITSLLFVFFSIDEELLYDPFNEDFGPLSLAQVHKFIRELVRLLVDPDYKNVKLYHYCSNQYDK